MSTVPSHTATLNDGFMIWRIGPAGWRCIDWGLNWKLRDSTIESIIRSYAAIRSARRFSRASRRSCLGESAVF